MVGLKKRKPTVWVVILCEIVQSETEYHVLESVLRLCSSLHGAEQYVKEPWTAPFSWYRVERRLVDDSTNDARAVRYYSHNGRPQKAAQERRAIFHFKRFAESKAAWTAKTKKTISR
jgi:hypothetical protein